MAADPSASEFSLFEAMANKKRVTVSRKDKPKRNATKPTVNTSAKPPSPAEAAAFFDEVTDDDASGASMEETESMGSNGSLASESDADSMQEHQPKLPTPDFAAVQRERDEEKAELLTQLAAMERDGVRLTRQFTMADRLEDIEWEHRRQKMAQDSASTVDFMKSMLGLAVTGVEMVNQRFGPVLALDGWSTSVQRDMDKFNAPLSRIYKKLWRKGRGINPFLHLALLLAGSMATYHVSNRLNASSSSAASAPPPRSAPRSQARPPMRTPSITPPTAVRSPSARPAMRPPMRPPAPAGARQPMRRPVMKGPVPSGVRNQSSFASTTATATDSGATSLVNARVIPKFDTFADDATFSTNAAPSAPQSTPASKFSGGVTEDDGTLDIAAIMD